MMTDKEFAQLLAASDAAYKTYSNAQVASDEALKPLRDAWLDANHQFNLERERRALRAEIAADAHNNPPKE